MGRFLKTVCAVAATGAFLMAILIGALAVYMTLYGNAHIKRAISELVGAVKPYVFLAQAPLAQPRERPLAPHRAHLPRRPGQRDDDRT